MQEPRLSLSASGWWWEACPVDRNKTHGPLLLVVPKLLPGISFGDDAVGQTFRKKATIGFLMPKMSLRIAQKLKCRLQICNYLVCEFTTCPPVLERPGAKFKSLVSSRSALSQSLQGSAGPQIDHKSGWSTDWYGRRSAARSRLCRPNSCIR